MIKLGRCFRLDKSNIPKELGTILSLIGDKQSDLEPKELFKDIDWELFIDLSLHHRVYPLLFSKLQSQELGIIPKHVSETITYYYKRNVFTMLHFCREMEAVAKLFAKNEICPLFLKGPVLAKDLYGEISLRTCGDLDILIPLEDLEKAQALLMNLGYEKDEYIQTVLNDWKWRHHHFTYFHPEKRIKIEMHWRLNPAPSKEPSFNELWRRKRQSTVTGYPVYFLGKEDLFFYLVTHGARHGWSRIRWLMDIHQLVKLKLDWSIIRSLLRKNQCLHIGGQSLHLVSQLLNTKIVEEMKPFIKGNRSKRLAQDAMFYLETMINLHTDPVPLEVSRYHSRHLYSLMSLSQKCLYWLSVCHPYYTDVETLPLPKNLHILYYPLRPFLWIWRRRKGHAVS